MVVYIIVYCVLYCHFCISFAQVAAQLALHSLSLSLSLCKSFYDQGNWSLNPLPPLHIPPTSLCSSAELPRLAYTLYLRWRNRLGISNPGQPN